MDRSARRRFWRTFRESYALERRQREATEKARPWTADRTGFWATLALAWSLNLVEAVADPDAGAWTALRYVVGVAWLGLAVWYLAEALSSRKARRSTGPRP